MGPPRGGSAPGAGAGADTAGCDADLVVAVLHRAGRCSVRELLSQRELTGWDALRLENAVTRAWGSGLVFIDRNDDLVAL